MHATHRSLVSTQSIVVIAAVAACTAGAQIPTGKEKDETLYAIGTLMARQLQQLGLSEEEYAHVQQGLYDATFGKAQAVEAADYREKINAFTAERQSTASAAEDVEAQKFLEVAAAEKGAVRTDSGLIYFERSAGTGASPVPTDTVEVHYEGTLRDGTVFDSSRQRGTAATFPMDRVIPCWTEGLQRMKVGGKSRLVCPPSIAYGERGAPPAIPGGAALSFEVELIAIKKK